MNLFAWIDSCGSGWRQYKPTCHHPAQSDQIGRFNFLDLYRSSPTGRAKHGSRKHRFTPPLRDCGHFEVSIQVMEFGDSHHSSCQHVEMVYSKYCNGSFKCFLINYSALSEKLQQTFFTSRIQPCYLFKLILRPQVRLTRASLSSWATANVR